MTIAGVCSGCYFLKTIPVNAGPEGVKQLSVCVNKVPKTELAQPGQPSALMGRARWAVIDFPDQWTCGEGADATTKVSYSVGIVGLPSPTPVIKVYSFGRYASDSNGNVSYTGVGFKPKAILFLASGGLYLTKTWSVGFGDGVTKGIVYHDVVAGGAYSQGWYNLTASVDGTNGWNALIASLDADGFTLTWTKFGTGADLTVWYLAMG